MASLSDLISGGGSGAPDAAASLIDRKQSPKSWYEYKPNSPLSAGKYIAKCSYPGKGTLKVTAKGVESYSRTSDNAFFELTESVDSVRMTFESDTLNSTVEYRDLPRWYPGPTQTTNWTTRAYDQVIACNADGTVWLYVSGYQGTLRRSVDLGHTWIDVARVDHITGDAATNYESYSVRWWNNRFILSCGPQETGISAVSPDGFVWTRLSTTLTAIVTTAAGSEAFVAGAQTTTNNVKWSTNGIDWSQRTISGLGQNISHVSWDAEQEQFIIFSEGSLMSVSTDKWATNWSAVEATPAIFKGLVQLNGFYYAVANNGAIYRTESIAGGTSTFWTLLVTLSTTTNQNHKLRVANGRLFYYDPNNNNLRWSDDGITWNIYATGLTQYGDISVVYNPALDEEEVLFVYNSNNWIRTTDGILRANQRSIAVNSFVTANATVTGLAYGNNIFVAGHSNNNIWTTTDGRDWTQRTSNTTQAINKMEYKNNIFMYAAQSGHIGTSVNGIDWVNTTGVLGGNHVYALEYGNGIWMAVGNIATRCDTSDDNGVTWTSNTFGTWSQVGNGVAWGNVDAETYADGVWVMVGNSGVIQRSTDNGATWTRVDNVIGNMENMQFGYELNTRSWYDVTYGNGIFVAVGDQITATSVDGVNWNLRNEARSFMIPTILRRVKWETARQQFVATGSGGIVQWSTNGKQWYSMNTMLTTDVYSYATNGAWKEEGSISLLGSTSGFIRDAYGSDEFFYYDDTIVPGGTFYNVAYNGDIYLMTNSNGIYRTRDWQNWLQPMYNRVAATDRIEHVEYGNGMFVGRDQSEAVWHSPDGIAWASSELVGGYTENIRLHNVVFAEGYFWGIYRPNQSARLFRSKDGIYWEAWFGWAQNQYPPRWIKKVGRYMVAFGHSSGAEGRYFHYTKDINKRRKDMWTTGDTGQTASWQITDIAATEWGVVYCYGNNICSVSPSLYGRTGSGTNQSALLYNFDGPTTQLGAYHAFSVGDRMYVVNGTTLYEVIPYYNDYVSTSTQYQTSFRAATVGNWGTQGYHTLPFGNGVAHGSGSRVYFMDAGVDTTFSLYNSTIDVIESQV